MKILKYLIKPLELMVLLCMLAALVYFRSIIFHANVNQYIDKAVVFAEEQFEIEIPSHVNNEIAQQVVAQVECVPAEADVAVSKEVVENVAVAAEVEQNDSIPVDDKSELIDTLAEAVNVINEKVDTLFSENKSEESAEVSKSRDDVTSQADQKVDDLNLAKENIVIEVKDEQPVDAGQVLNAARKLFWSGDLQASEKLYLDLANRNEANADTYGELGNVYYTQGKWKQAGEAYYEAALRLLPQKNNTQVNDRLSYLLRVIEGLDTESAEKLKSKISG